MVESVKLQNLESHYLKLRAGQSSHCGWGDKKNAARAMTTQKCCYTLINPLETGIVSTRRSIPEPDSPRLRYLPAFPVPCQVLWYFPHLSRVPAACFRPFLSADICGERGVRGAEDGIGHTSTRCPSTTRRGTARCTTAPWSSAAPSVLECAGRSARWNKVAWLRRSYFKYQWLVWMDLDAIFARPDASLADILDPAYDLHVTHDFGIYETHDVERRHRGSSVSGGPEKEPLRWAYEGGKINTGFFALKTSSPWSFIFLEQVWAHNDFGMGKSDQASINHVISLMSPEEKKKHIKVRSCTQSRAGKSRLIYLFFLCRPGSLALAAEIVRSD